MKTTYKVQMMNNTNYEAMMRGEYIYSVETVFIEATSKEEAYETVKAQNPTMVVNTFVESVEEIEAQEKARQERIAKEEAKKAQAKARKQANIERKAQEMGMSVEEYKAWKKVQDKKKRYMKEIEEFEKEIAWRKKFIEEN